MDETTDRSDRDVFAIDDPVFLIGLDENNQTAVIMHWPLRGQQEVIDCALSRSPRLMTQVMWRSFAMADRMVLAEEGSVVADAVVLDDMTQVLPETTLRWLSSWQNLINTGAVWHADGEIGRIATELVDRGLCLLGPQPVQGHWAPVHSRHDKTPGSSGTPQFVRAMMGSEYEAFMAKVPS